MPQMSITGHITLQDEIVEITVEGEYEEYHKSPMDGYIRATDELRKDRKKEETS